MHASNSLFQTCFACKESKRLDRNIHHFQVVTLPAQYVFIKQPLSQLKYSFKVCEPRQCQLSYSINRSISKYRYSLKPLNTGLELFWILMSTASRWSVARSAAPLVGVYNHSPLWSCSLPGSRQGSFCVGPKGCSSSRCKCDCRPQWRDWPPGGCWVAARRCSSAVCPGPAPHRGTRAVGNTPEAPTPSSLSSLSPHQRLPDMYWT